MNTANIPPHPSVARRTPDLRTAIVTVVALVAAWTTVLVASLFWVWGAIFTTWAILGIRSGETFLVTRLRRSDQPVLFWLVSLSWLGIGVLWVIFPS